MGNYYVHVVPRKCNNHARQKLYHLKIAVDHLCSTELAALVVGATLQLQKKNDKDDHFLGGVNDFFGRDDETQS